MLGVRECKKEWYFPDVAKLLWCWFYIFNEIHIDVLVGLFSMLKKVAIIIH